MTVGQRIRQLRKEANMTQTAFANFCGVNLYTVRGLEEEKRNTSIAVIACIANAFSITLSEFFEGVVQ